MNWLNKNTLIIIVAVILVVAGYFGWSSSPAKGDGFIIGATLPLTGAAQIYGQYNKEGMDLALLDINRQGGINGKKLSIIYDDTGSQNTNAVSAITKMININKVPVIFGSPPSSEVLAEAPIAEKNRTVLIVAGGGVPSLRDAGDYIFRVKVSVDKEIEELKKLATNVFRAKTAYILYIQNDYGEGTRKFVSQIFPQSGIAVLGSEGFGADEGDYRSALIKAQKTNPDVIVISGWPKNLGLILKQAKELGLKKQFIASGGSIGPDILAIAGSAADGLVYTMEFDIDSLSTSTQTFRREYQQKYGRDPELFATMAYDETVIISEMLKVCDAHPTCIKDHLYQVQNYDGASGIISFDDHGDVLKPMFYMTVKDGKFIRYTK